MGTRQIKECIYQRILEEINEGIHVINECGETIIYNRKMEEIESMKRENVLHRKLADVFHFRTENESTLLQALQHGKVSKNVKQTYFNEQKKEINTINHTFPVFKNNKIIGAVEIANDVSRMERIFRERWTKRGVATYSFENIIGESKALKEIIQHAQRAARTSSNVLIIGETGTGKELFAHSIHQASDRAKHPFITQNCATLPEHLIEGLLFGTKKGAFTGAIDRPGLFEQAEGGTLFLDEINALDHALQAKLLRALQEKTIRRLGDTEDRLINVRIIAAMNEDPIEAIASGRLRKDIYYRLGVVTLFIPPLRERVEDVFCLTEYFLEQYNQLFNMGVKKLSKEVEQFFQTYDWPGNVRELQHLIEGAMNLISEEKEIQLRHLPVHLTNRKLLQEYEHVDKPLNQETSVIQPVEKEIGKGGHPSLMEEYMAEIQLESRLLSNDLKTNLAQFEAYCITQALRKHHGNITKAAKELGLNSRQSLQYRINKLGITASVWKES